MKMNRIPDMPSFKLTKEQTHRKKKLMENEVKQIKLKDNEGIVKLINSFDF